VKRIPTLFLLLSIATHARAGADWGSTLRWDSPETNFILFVGDDLSRGYVYTNSSAWLPLESLEYGTNKIRVASRRVIGETNAVISDLSNPVTITRLPAPTLRINVELLGSTNLSAWTAVTNFSLNVSKDQPQGFYRATTSIEPEPDTITVQPPAPQ